MLIARKSKQRFLSNLSPSFSPSKIKIDQIHSDVLHKDLGSGTGSQKPPMKMAKTKAEPHQADPEQTKNCIVVRGPIGKTSEGKATSYDLIQFDNIRDFDSDYEKKNFPRTPRNLSNLIERFGNYYIIFVVGFFLGVSPSLFTCEIYRFTTFMSQVGTAILCMIIAGYAFSFFPLAPSFSKRIIKWTLDEFSDKSSKCFCTSPMIRDISGYWSLVVRQTSDEHITFGLIATYIAKHIESIVADVEVSATIKGCDLIRNLKDIKFIHKYECEGDCGFSQPIRVNFKQLKNDKLDINCRIQFQSKEVLFIVKIVNFLSGKYTRVIRQDEVSKSQPRQSGHSSGVGTIQPDDNLYSPVSARKEQILTGTELEGCKTTFLNHSETNSFVWKIPNFPKHLKNVECWGLFSPQLFVNSYDFCSIWRLQLVELHGVFRIHLQVRGLPSGISQIKARHLVELTDNFGENIVPEHCGCTNKYPEYLRMWDTRRISLYRRETLLERFLSPTDTLTLRVSFQCEPNDTVQIDNNSSDWILHD